MKDRTFIIDTESPDDIPEKFRKEFQFPIGEILRMRDPEYVRKLIKLSRLNDKIFGLEDEINKRIRNIEALTECDSGTLEIIERVTRESGRVLERIEQLADLWQKRNELDSVIKDFK